jgi:hypothetical protein
MQQHFFSFESGELQKSQAETSSHCSSVQERLVTYGSEALDSAEHLGLILGSQKAADALLEHFGSLTVLAGPPFKSFCPSFHDLEPYDSLVPFGSALSHYGRSVKRSPSIVLLQSQTFVQRCAF